MIGKKNKRPELTFPADVSAYVEQEYLKAEKILEYGSGGSTVLAAEMSGKTILTIESDRSWAENMEAYFNSVSLRSQPEIVHADIGPTGAWGKPKKSKFWPSFKDYALIPWRRADPLIPDVVLIDGRFRAACFLATFFLTTKPVVVLFDDYLEREKYHFVEELAKPIEFVGRMARFDLPARPMEPKYFNAIVEGFTSANFHRPF